MNSSLASSVNIICGSTEAELLRRQCGGTDISQMWSSTIIIFHYNSWYVVFLFVDTENHADDDFGVVLHVVVVV